MSIFLKGGELFVHEYSAEEKVEELSLKQDIDSLNYSGILDLNKDISQFSFIHKNYLEYLVSIKLHSFDYKKLIQTITYDEDAEITGE